MAEAKKRKVNLNTEKLDAIESITAGRTYGTDQQFLNNVEENREKVKNVINMTNTRHNSILGDGIIEFFTAMLYEDNIKNNKGKVKEELPSNSNNKFNDILSNTNVTDLSNMFDAEKERVILYEEYESVVNYIPQVYQALDAMADAILSPDDFSKKVLNFYYDGSDSPSVNEQDKVIKNLNNIERIYNFEGKLKNIIFKSLYLGDSFVLVTSLKKEFNKLLTESSDIFINESSTLTESNFNISKDEYSVIRELFLEETNTTKNDKNKEVEDLSDKDLKRYLMNLIDTNIEFSNNSSSIIEKELKVAKEFKETPINSDLDSIINKSIKSNTDKSSSFLLTNVTDEEKNKYKSINMDNIMGDSIGKNKKQKDTDIRGSYIKTLDATRIIKLKMGSTCFGYFYIETNLPERTSKDPMSLSSSSRISDFKLRKTVDINSNNIDEELNNPKVKLITDIFGRALSTKVNKKFIEDNREFKTLIYELLKNDYITKKRVRIVFLSPDEVFHFNVDEDEDGYGTSKLSKVLFTCKIYIATLITNLMMKLSRSLDHRAFYVETGLSKDVEGTIQAFIRDIKTKEIRLNDLQTIDTIFRSIGQLII